MDNLRFADKLARLRRERRITQEMLADFIGVTKASVSKWENRQSLPDITLLPQLASFFDVTVDELLGYEPQLSREQIQKKYREFAADFAKKPFDEVMEESRRQVHRYYSCYPFLMQVCVLWLNHLPMEEEKEEQQRILRDIHELCGHIINHCNEVSVCNDAVSVKAMVDLQFGRIKEVIDELEDSVNVSRLSLSNDSILVQAYQMAGEKDKAVSCVQISGIIVLRYILLSQRSAGGFWGYLELRFWRFSPYFPMQVLWFCWEQVPAFCYPT